MHRLTAGRTTIDQVASVEQLLEADGTVVLGLYLALDHPIRLWNFVSWSAYAPSRARPTNLLGKLNVAKHQGDQGLVHVQDAQQHKVDMFASTSAL